MICSSALHEETKRHLLFSELLVNSCSLGLRTCAAIQVSSKRSSAICVSFSSPGMCRKCQHPVLSHPTKLQMSCVVSEEARAWVGQVAAWKADSSTWCCGAEGCTTGPLLLNSLTPAHRGNVWHSKVWHGKDNALPLFSFQGYFIVNFKTRHG